jgi:hypothetical protein
LEGRKRGLKKRIKPLTGVQKDSLHTIFNKSGIDLTLSLENWLILPNIPVICFSEWGSHPVHSALEVNYGRI